VGVWDFINQIVCSVAILKKDANHAGEGHASESKDDKNLFI
jgi:hypothetical protein